MKKFVVKLRCCSSVVIRMLSATSVVTKGKSIFGWVVRHLLNTPCFHSSSNHHCRVFRVQYFVIWQIVMEYCGGGSVADLMNVTEEPLEEYQIAYICREALKVSITLISLKMNI